MPARSELDLSDLRIGTVLESADARTRSHLSDGRVVGWYGAPEVVVDAEVADAPVPTALGLAYGCADFWGRWTRAECAAKLTGTPIAVWLRRHGLEVPAWLESRTACLSGCVVTLARRRAGGVTEDTNRSG